MSGLFTVNVSEARGTIAVPADLDSTAVVIGCSSLGSGLSSFFLSGTSAQASVGYGDASDTLCQIIEQPGAGRKYPAALYTVADDGAAGSYGTIDVAAVTGTCIPAVDDSVEPYGTDELRVLVVAGGTVGTDGITYRLSRDDGRHYGNVLALGTASTISVPNAGSGFVLNPPSAALYTSLNNLRTAALAHFLITSGSPAVHGAADSANNTALSAIPAATTYATAIALFNGLLTTLASHVIKTSGSVHGAADTTAQTAIAAISAATTASQVVARLPALIAAYNAHRILTSGSVHGSADGTNTCAASTAAQGTLVAGDTWTVRTYAPQPSTTNVADAFTALAATAVDFGLVVCEFPCDATMLATITAGLDDLAAVGKEVTCLARTRIPDAETSETDAAWNTSVAADFDGEDDSRVNLRAAYGHITDAMTGNEYLRADLAQWAADVVAAPRAVWPDSPAHRLDGTPNIAIVDSDGNLIGHDEGPQGASTGLSNNTLGNRFSCVQRLAVPSVRSAVYATVPWVLFGAGELVQTLMARRLANACKRVAVAAGVPTLGSRLFYTSTGPTSGLLTAQSLRAVQSAIFAAVSSAFSTEFDNAQNADLNTGLVQVNPVVAVAPGKLLTVSVTVAPNIGGYVQTLDFTLAIQQ